MQPRPEELTLTGSMSKHRRGRGGSAKYTCSQQRLCRALLAVGDAAGVDRQAGACVRGPNAKAYIKAGALDGRQLTICSLQAYSLENRER